MGVRWHGGKFGLPIFLAYPVRNHCMAGPQIPSITCGRIPFALLHAAEGEAATGTLNNLHPDSVPSVEYTLGHYVSFGFPKRLDHSMPVWRIKILKYFYIHFHINLRVDLPNLTY